VKNGLKIKIKIQKQKEILKILHLFIKNILNYVVLIIKIMMMMMMMIIMMIIIMMIRLKNYVRNGLKQRI